jgi:hypothetical protein
MFQRIRAMAPLRFTGRRLGLQAYVEGFGQSQTLVIRIANARPGEAFTLVVSDARRRALGEVQVAADGDGEVSVRTPWMRSGGGFVTAISATGEGRAAQEFSAPG